MSDLAVLVDWDLSVDRTRLFDEVAVGFLLGYDKAHTRSAYQSDLRCLASWCIQIGIDPLDAQRAHLDAYARSLEAIGLAPSSVARRSRVVCDGLAEAMARHGIPDQILTDNGKVFTGRFGPGNGEVLFDRICRENGIRHLLTAPRSPTITGKVERFHKTIKKEAPRRQTL